VNTKISREAARIHLAGAGDDPAEPGARDRLAHIGAWQSGFRPVAAVSTSCTATPSLRGGKG